MRLYGSPQRMAVGIQTAPTSGKPAGGRIDAATLCAIGEVHNVDPLSVNFYLCTINRKLRETLRIVKKKDRDGELLC